MIIWSEFRMGQYRDDDHREDAPHFILFYHRKTLYPSFALQSIHYLFSHSFLIDALVTQMRILTVNKSSKS